MYKILTLVTDTYANYGTQDFNTHMFYRTECLLNELKLGNTVFQIDSDVVLFKDHDYFYEKLGDHDMIAQQECTGDLCTGFFICKSNPVTISFWETVLDRMKNGTPNDEIASNVVLKEGFKIDIEWFSHTDIMSYGVISGGHVWNGEDFEMPSDINAFHANYTVGLSNKAILLEKAKKAHDSIIL